MLFCALAVWEIYVKHPKNLLMLNLTTKKETRGSSEPVYPSVWTQAVSVYPGLTRCHHLPAQIQPLSIHWHGGALSFLCGCSPSNHNATWNSSHFSKDHNKQFVFVSLSTCISKLCKNNCVSFLLIMLTGYKIVLRFLICNLFLADCEAAVFRKWMLTW